MNTPICKFLQLILLLQHIILRLWLYSMQLYKLKLQLGSHIVEAQFVANDNLLMDIENSQMLQCIICRTKQTCANDLYQQFNL
jgi:hypothetical protein